MGGLCSKTTSRTPVNAWAADNRRQVVDDYKLKTSSKRTRTTTTTTTTSTAAAAAAELAPPPAVYIGTSQQQQQPPRYSQDGPALVYDDGDATDDFYDGIPRYKSTSGGSGSFRKAKVSEVGSRIGRGAVSVLDTLGSSMTNLNSGTGFNSAPPAKGNEIAIIAFEIANTVVKGYNLMQSISIRSIRNLKEVVFCSEGVQYLVSKDTDELLRIFAADKREELKIFSGEVVRFGNRCKDPQWHNLDRYFEKISKELIPQKHLKEEASSVIQQLMTLVQHTAELYHEFHALDRFEQDYERKQYEDDNLSSTQKGGDSLGILRSELKSQRKLVKSLKKKSLWSKSMEEVMEKLVEIVHFLYLEMHAAFGSAEGQKTVEGATNKYQKLGPAGLSLHYANIVLQIDTLVVRSSAPPPTTRDTLYQSLPPNIKSSLRSKLHSFHIKEELTVTEIKAEMEKTLHWLVPMAANTAKDHHGFGWVGEWASTGAETNRKPAPQTEVIRIETFHHANREKTEACVLKLVLWLHYLVAQSKPASTSVGMRSPVKSIPTTTPKTNKQLKDIPPSTVLTTDDQQMLQDVSKRKRVPGVSKSQDFDSANSTLGNQGRLNKSNSYSSGEGTKKLLPFSRLSSGIPVVDFGIDKEKALDVIDRVDMHRDHHHPRE